MAYLEYGVGYCDSGFGVDDGAVDNVEGDDTYGGGGGDCGSGVVVGGDDANCSGVHYGSGFSCDVDCGSGVGVDGGAVDSDDGGDDVGGGDDAYDSGARGDYDVGGNVYDGDDGNYVVKVVKLIVTIQ